MLLAPLARAPLPGSKTTATMYVGRVEETIDPFAMALRSAGWAIRLISPDLMPFVAGGRSPIQRTQYQGHFHDAFRDNLVQDFTSRGATVVREAPLHLLAGNLTARSDFIGRPRNGPNAIVVDVKTGDNPMFTPAQRVVYGHCTAGGLVRTNDARLSTLGLPIGVPLPPMDFMIIRSLGPATDYTVRHFPAGMPPFVLPARL